MGRPKVIAQIEDLSVQKANIASPALTGVPKSTTPEGEIAEQIANVEYVETVVLDAKNEVVDGVVYHDEKIIAQDYEGKINAEQVLGLADVAKTGVLTITDDSTGEKYTLGVNNGKLYIRKEATS